jgi:hypothetical protein
LLATQVPSRHALRCPLELCCHASSSFAARAHRRAYPSFLTARRRTCSSSRAGCACSTSAASARPSFPTALARALPPPAFYCMGGALAQQLSWPWLPHRARASLPASGRWPTGVSGGEWQCAAMSGCEQCLKIRRLKKNRIAQISIFLSNFRWTVPIFFQNSIKFYVNSTDF